MVLDDAVLNQMSVVADGWGDSLQHGDMTLEDFYQSVNKVHRLHESAFRRMINSLGLHKNERGYYGYADALVVLTWMRRRDRFYSCKEFMRCAGADIHQRAKGIDFSRLVSYEG